MALNVSKANRSLSTLPKMCALCGRRTAKVAIKLTDGTFRGICPTDWTRDRDRWVAKGAVVVRDNRRRPKVTPQVQDVADRVAQFVGDPTVVMNPDGDAVVTATDAAGNDRKWTVTADGVPTPVQA